MQLYQNTDFYFFRKPHGVASTFGKEKSFLDYIFVDNIDMPNFYISYNVLEANILEYIDQQIKDLNIDLVLNINQQQDIISNLIATFGEEKEYGLLNRLDNDTGGLLYFAKNKEVYNRYKSQQSENLLKKFYIAQVMGNPFFKGDQKKIDIDYPIMHHKFSEDRMICVIKPGDIDKGEGRQHNVSTNISLLNFDKSQNKSTLLVSISKGIRHQIRIHLSSIGCPVIGENIYHKDKNSNFLHLRSIGFE